MTATKMIMKMTKTKTRLKRTIMNLLEISTRPRTRKDEDVAGHFFFEIERGIYDDKDDHGLVRTVDHVYMTMFVAL